MVVRFVILEAYTIGSLEREITPTWEGLYIYNKLRKQNKKVMNIIKHSSH